MLVERSVIEKNPENGSCGVPMHKNQPKTKSLVQLYLSSNEALPKAMSTNGATRG
jgi:hypothetical protein